MRRMIASTLVFFILFANLAWATGMDEVGADNKAASTPAFSVQTHSDRPGEDTRHDDVAVAPCNHCCHASAHYLGFVREASLVFADNTCHLSIQYLTAHYVRDADAPPVPPPNA